jgi:hypothetical protein
VRMPRVGSSVLSAPGPYTRAACEKTKIGATAVYRPVRQVRY